MTEVVHSWWVPPLASCPPAPSLQPHGRGTCFRAGLHCPVTSLSTGAGRPKQRRQRYALCTLGAPVHLYWQLCYCKRFLVRPILEGGHDSRI